MEQRLFAGQSNGWRTRIFRRAICTFHILWPQFDFRSESLQATFTGIGRRLNTNIGDSATYDSFPPGLHGRLSY